MTTYKPPTYSAIMKLLMELEKEQMTLMGEQFRTYEQYLVETKKRHERIAALENSLSWIQDLADSGSFTEGGDSPEMRLEKIRVCCTEALQVPPP